MHTELILEKLHIVHFKGIKELTINFDPVCQNIWGDNGTYKTSVADAWFWLLFGKNSLGEADFGIKPLDNNNVKVENTEVDVTGNVNLNGRKIVLRHVFREVWQAKRGSATKELTGNTHDYFVDNAPHTLAEYKAVINRLIEEAVFPFVTNPLHFTRLPWQKQRQALLKVGGDVSDVDFARTDIDFAPLIEILAHKTTDKYKQELSAGKKNCKDDMERIPARIDEVRRGMPEEQDYEAIQAQIDSRQEALVEIDNELTSISEAAKAKTVDIRKHQTKVRALKLDQDVLADRIRSAERAKQEQAGAGLKSKERELEQIVRGITSANDAVDSLVIRKDRIHTQMATGRADWQKINAEELPSNEDELKCPTCKQDLPADEKEQKVADLKKNFQDDKARRLKNNVEKGIQLKKDFTELELQITARKQEKIELEAKNDQLVEDIRGLQALPNEEKPDVQTLITTDAGYIELSQKIASLEADAPKEEVSDTTASKLRKQTINTELDGLKKSLGAKEQREKATTRIEELKKQEEDYSKELVRLQGLDNLLERFIKAKIDTLSDRINSKFEIVRFKMFNQLQNGGLEETCEVTVDGVPFSDLNTAKKINAGVDVINVLCDHFSVRAPIFIDNRESTVKLLNTTSQVINLYVREGVKPLHVGKHPPILQEQGQLELS